jgi:hypothetical protein
VVLLRYVTSAASTIKFLEPCVSKLSKWYSQLGSALSVPRCSLEFRPLLALQRRLGRGKASRLCPCSSDVDLFGYGEGVIDLNAEIAHCALNLLVPQQELHRPQIAGAAVDECRLGSAQ